MFTTQLKRRDGTVISERPSTKMATVRKNEFELRLQVRDPQQMGVITKDAEGHIVSRHTHDDETGRWLGPFEDSEPTEAQELGWD